MTTANTTGGIIEGRNPWDDSIRIGAKPFIEARRLSQTFSPTPPQSPRRSPKLKYTSPKARMLIEQSMNILDNLASKEVEIDELLTSPTLGDPNYYWPRPMRPGYVAAEPEEGDEENEEPNNHSPEIDPPPEIEPEPEPEPELEESRNPEQTNLPAL